MCGIAGYFGQRIVAPETLDHMLVKLAPRGPDAQHAARFDAKLAPTDKPAPNALLHARLSIIDPRPEADQPMANAAGDVWICYNGEVYGWQDHARRLRDLGYEFRTRSDTEFILHAYEAWGDDMLSRLRGMYALVILDVRRRRLLLARDRMGKKPLLYYVGEGEFGFASTVRALLPYLPADRRALDPAGIDAYLTHRYTPAPLTAYRHIRRLPNGHRLEYDLERGTLRQSAYWRAAPADGNWLATLDESVRLRTVADRPVGLFLSGGIDSTLIAARLGALGCTQIHAFTAAFPGSDMDESRDAARVSTELGLPHTAVEVPRSIRPDFARIVADLDEPFADPSSFPLWYLARETSREVKVVLGGDGGDELFAGYKRYAKHMRSAWRRGWRVGRSRWPAAAEPTQLRRILGELALSWEEAYSLRFSGMHPGLRRVLQPWLDQLPAVHWRAAETAGLPPLETLLAIDMANYLPEYILRKGDLTTMAHGLELRAPLLDQVLLGTVLALDPEQRFTDPPKLALAGACPPCRELGLFERKKRGFNPPLSAWLREDLRARFDDLGHRLSAATAGQIDAAAADALAAAYLGGREHLAEQVLQLLILDESLAQLNAEAARP